MNQSALGLDVGGANLKAAHSCGSALSLPFELWKSPGRLPEALHRILAKLPIFDRLAVTMTGELCDCFETKRQGVDAIVSAVEKVARPFPFRVWRTDGSLVDAECARTTPLETSASNWTALGAFSGRFAPTGTAILIDIGSTTTDLVPLIDGKTAPAARTDKGRLRSGELVYTGIRRTPLCSLLGDEGAAELFATTEDAYLFLGELPEEPTSRITADGRPATRIAAHGRLARMVCADRESFGESETHDLALLVKHRQIARIAEALKKVVARLPQPPETWIISGAGEFLAREVLREVAPTTPLISLAEKLGGEISPAACAYALAVLAAESNDAW